MTTTIDETDRRGQPDWTPEASARWCGKSVEWVLEQTLNCVMPHVRTPDGFRYYSDSVQLWAMRLARYPNNPWGAAVPRRVWIGREDA